MSLSERPKLAKHVENEPEECQSVFCGPSIHKRRLLGLRESSSSSIFAEISNEQPGRYSIFAEISGPKKKSKS
jgi:hypothetical protein